MRINIICSCGHRFAEGGAAGQSLTCPSCGKSILIPGSLKNVPIRTRQTFSIQCSCGNRALLDKPPQKDFTCPQCGAPLGEIIQSIKQQAPQVSVEETRVRAEQSDAVDPAGVRLGIGTVLLLIAAAITITFIIMKMLMK